MNTKVSIVYYSLEGNCQFLAESLSQKLNCACQRLRVEKEPPEKGVKKFAQGGKMALSGEDPGLYPLEISLKDTKILIVIYPLWAASFPPAMQAFFKQYGSLISQKKVILVCSSMSGKGAGSFKKAEQFVPQIQIQAGYSVTNPLKKKEQAQEVLDQIAFEVKNSLKA